MNNYLSFLLEVLPWLGGAVGGFLIFVLKNRRPVLTYRVSHQRVGMTADDRVHGKVEVSYRGNVVHNLFLSTIEIKNASISDLENLDLKIYRGVGGIFLLTEDSYIENTINLPRFDAHSLKGTMIPKESSNDKTIKNHF